MTERSEVRVLWLRPTSGENISIRRERIAEHLERWNVEVMICDSSGLDSLHAITEAVIGEYDVIIGNVRIGLYLGYVLSVLLRKPLIGDVSDPIQDLKHLPRPVYTIVRELEWWILSQSNSCFVVESKSYEAAKQRGLDPILAKNSVDYDRFHNPSEQSKQRAQTILGSSGVDLDKPIAIYLGSMVPHYHLEEIGEAAKITPSWEFVFVGEERGAGIEDIVSGVENAHFIGSYEYDLMPGFLHHSDVGICLTDKEQPLKILEYGAAGLPTLGYAGKLRENFTDDEIVFVDADPLEISDALEDIASDWGKARRYGKNLQQKAEQNSWKAVAEKYYEQIVEVSER